MIFIYQLFNKTNPYHAKSASFFKQIEDEKMIGVTSSFTRSEYLEVIKTELAKASDSIPSSIDIQSSLDNFDDFITHMGIELFDSDDLTNSDARLFRECHARIENAIPFKGKDNKWRMLNGADSLLLVFAEKTGCQEIASNDDGFRTSKSKVKPHILRDLY